MWINQSFIIARKEVLFLILIALIITIEPSTFILVMSVALCFYFREKLNGIKVFIPRQSLLTWVLWSLSLASSLGIILPSLAMIMQKWVCHKIMIDFSSLTTMLLNGVFRLLFTTIQYYSSEKLHALFFVTLASFGSFLSLKLQFLALVSNIIFYSVLTLSYSFILSFQWTPWSESYQDNLQYLCSLTYIVDLQYCGLWLHRYWKVSFRKVSYGLSCQRSGYC